MYMISFEKRHRSTKKLYVRKNFSVGTYAGIFSKVNYLIRLIRAGYPSENLIVVKSIGLDDKAELLFNIVVIKNDNGYENKVETFTSYAQFAKDIKYLIKLPK